MNYLDWISLVWISWIVSNLKVNFLYCFSSHTVPWDQTVMTIRNGNKLIMYFTLSSYCYLQSSSKPIHVNQISRITSILALILCFKCHSDKCSSLYFYSFHLWWKIHVDWFLWVFSLYELSKAIQWKHCLPMDNSVSHFPIIFYLPCFWLWSDLVFCTIVLCHLLLFPNTPAQKICHTIFFFVVM